jgi:hypothetical protein
VAYIQGYGESQCGDEWPSLEIVFVSSLVDTIEVINRKTVLKENWELRTVWCD